jgi:hypothetical protein
MFTSWVMLIVSFAINIFAASLLAAPFTQSGIKLNSMALCFTKLSYSVSCQNSPDVAALVCLVNPGRLSLELFFYYTRISQKSAQIELAGTKLIEVHSLILIFFISIWTSTSAFCGLNLSSPSPPEAIVLKAKVAAARTATSHYLIAIEKLVFPI